MGNKLYVGNLPFTVSEDQLSEVFGQIGEVGTVRIPRDYSSGRSKGFGFVEMVSEADAQKAMSELNDSEIDSRKIVVSEARERTENA
jgi:cold-inducible RNA-binding protein